MRSVVCGLWCGLEGGDEGRERVVENVRAGGGAVGGVFSFGCSTGSFTSDVMFGLYRVVQTDSFLLIFSKAPEVKGNALFVVFVA